MRVCCLFGGSAVVILYHTPCKLHLPMLLLVAFQSTLLGFIDFRPGQGYSMWQASSAELRSAACGHIYKLFICHKYYTTVQVVMCATYHDFHVCGLLQPKIMVVALCQKKKRLDSPALELCKLDIQNAC